MRLGHAVAVAATWLFTSSAAHPSVTLPEVPTLFADPLPASATVAAFVPFETRARVNLAAVWWTAPRREPLKRLADRYGMKPKELRKLDPTLVGDRVAKGQRVLV